MIPAVPIESEAELAILDGPLAGRYDLGPHPVDLGRAPTCSIPLPGPGASPLHCRITRESSGYRLVDLDSGSGTFVNGLRVAAHWLADGDQISVGETDLVFRTRHPAATRSSVLLDAVTALYLMRTLASAQGFPHESEVERQFVYLLARLMPLESAAVLIANGEIALKAAARDRGVPGLEGLAFAVCRSGVSNSEDGLLTAVPVYARDEIAGMIAVRRAAQAASGDSETLTEIAILAGVALENVRELETLRVENSLLQERLGIPASGILGESPVMRKLLETIARVAPQDSTVLILGESGTGKELAARAIHQQSRRRAKPFGAINCAALTDSLLESELFGHEKGAFTGAVVQKKGKLEIADGGTVFLDEIGELAPSLQAKLLRVLQQREFERVGGTRTLPLDVRILAATNRDLAAEVRRGAFREDLYYRLNVLPIRMPPLRDRGGDILLLARHFLAQFSARCSRRLSGFTPEAERAIAVYTWPGNVRELENAIERAVVLGDADRVCLEDLPETIVETAPPAAAAGEYQAVVGSAKRESIVKAWQQSAGDYKRAAQLLGMHPNSLLRLVRNLGLRDVLKQV